MESEFKDKWNNILEKKVYIYGAQYSAGYVYDLIENIGNAKMVLGFVVSNTSENPRTYRKLDVVSVNSIIDKSTRIIVPNRGKFLDEIKYTLSSMSFSDVWYVGQLAVMSQFENNPFLNTEKRWYEKYRKDGDYKIRKKICEILAEGQPRFGALEPYQSLKEIGLIGKRPTEYRIEKYGLRDILTKDMKVLDIGCNTAFIDFSISDNVRSVLGIEHETSFVEIAKLVKQYLGIENVNVWQGEFLDWIKENETNKYDMIFSFAIHRWIGLDPTEYAHIISNHLCTKGYVCIESHVGDIDSEYESCILEIQRLGFRIIKDEFIDDSRDGARKFVIAQKDYLNR